MLERSRSAVAQAVEIGGHVVDLLTAEIEIRHRRMRVGEPCPQRARGKFLTVGNRSEGRRAVAAGNGRPDDMAAGAPSLGKHLTGRGVASRMRGDRQSSGG